MGSCSIYRAVRGICHPIHLENIIQISESMPLMTLTYLWCARHEHWRSAFEGKISDVHRVKSINILFTTNSIQDLLCINVLG